MANGRSIPKITALYIYPVKSCRGISLQQGQISSTGLAYDRQWMVVNDRGRMCTIRSDPRLALVDVHLPVEVLGPGWGPPSTDASLRLSAPGMEPLHVPLVRKGSGPTYTEATVWDWTGDAVHEGTDAASWFSCYLGKSCRLVRFAAGHSKRPTSQKFANGYEVGFSDGFPFLMVSESSLAQLNDHLEEPLPMNRFRPNIVVDKCEPFEEDMWKTFKVVQPQQGGELFFHGVKPCSRCKITATDAETAELGPEPLQSLRTFREGGLLALPPSFHRQVYFGINLVCDQSTTAHQNTKLISIGDELHVINRRSSYAQFCDVSSKK